MTPKISIVVLLWNGEPFVDDCLTALRAQDYAEANYEIIVVDNASEDRSVEIAEQYEPAQLICNEINAGYAGGNNVGIEAAGGDIMVLLNQDTAVQPGWLTAIAAAFDTDPDIGIVGCKSYFPNSRTIQHAGGIVNATDAFTQHIGHGEEDTNQFDELVDVEYVTGAAFAIHRRLIQRIGVLDEGFNPAFYEEIDYCFRARRAGFRVVYQPEAVLYHHETSSLSETSYARVAAFHRNRIRFVLRHWDGDALHAFAEADRAALQETIWIDDTIARARGYWDNLVSMPFIARQRRTDETLGPALPESTVQWVSQALKDLREQAYDRVRSVIESHQPAEIELDAVRQIDRTVIDEQIQTLYERQRLEEHRFSSDVPILGPLVARFRELWLSVAARWYILPIINQQSQYNEHVSRIVAEFIQRDEQRWRNTARNMHKLEAAIQNLEKRVNSAEILEDMLQADDVETSDAIQTLLSYLKDSRESRG